MNKEFETLHLHLIVFNLKTSLHGCNLTSQGLDSFTELANRTRHFYVQVLHLVSELIGGKHSYKAYKLKTTILKRYREHIQILKSFALQICSRQERSIYLLIELFVCKNILG